MSANNDLVLATMRVNVEGVTGDLSGEGYEANQAENPALPDIESRVKALEAGGGGGGSAGGSDDIFIVRMVSVENEEDETFMITTDKTFDEVWEARKYDESLGGRKLILLERDGRYSQLVNYSSEEDGTKCLFFASGFGFGAPSFDKSPNLTYSVSATHTLWRNDGKMYTKQFELPNEYCETDAYEEILNVPQPW